MHLGHDRETSRGSCSCARILALIDVSEAVLHFTKVAHGLMPSSWQRPDCFHALPLCQAAMLAYKGKAYISVQMPAHCHSIDRPCHITIDCNVKPILPTEKSMPKLEVQVIRPLTTRSQVCMSQQKSHTSCMGYAWQCLAADSSAASSRFLLG